jgi:hypothetical protein
MTWVYPWLDGEPLPVEQPTVEDAVRMLDEHRCTLVKLSERERKKNPASEAARRANEALARFDAKTAVWGSTL